jgi:hypothetical protein
MSQQTFLASVPAQEQVAFANAIAALPVSLQGPVISWLEAVIAKLKAMGVTINWQQILALIPLAIAAFADPLTGMGPLIMAIIALFNTPTPVAVP